MHKALGSIPSIEQGEEKEKERERKEKKEAVRGYRLCQVGVTDWDSIGHPHGAVHWEGLERLSRGTRHTGLRGGLLAKGLGEEDEELQEGKRRPGGLPLRSSRAMGGLD